VRHWDAEIFVTPKHATVDYRSFFKLSPEMLCILEWDGRFQDVSLVWEEKVGFSMTDLQRKPLLDFVHPLDRDTTIAALRELRKGFDVHGLEHRFLCRDGSYRTLVWSASPRPTEDRMFAVVRDITDLHGELHRLKALVDASPDFIGMTTLDGKALYVNPGGMKMTGHEGEDYRTKQIPDFLSPSNFAYYRDSIAPAVMADGSWVGESEFVHADGAPLPISWQVVLLRDERGEPSALGTIARDVSPQKRLEEALKQAIREMQTPIIQVWDGVLVLPVIGLVDSTRASEMTESLLDAIVRDRCRMAILDLTGVATIDTSTLNHLFKMVTASSLLGSRCVVSGIAPHVAQTIVQLGLDLSDLLTFRSLKEALRFAMKEVPRRVKQ